MQERNRLYFLILLVATVALLVCAFAVYTLYQAALTQQAQQLAEMVKSQARLIESVARYDARYQVPDFADSADATISQVLDALSHSKGFGETGTFTLARHEGDQIVFMSPPREGQADHPQAVPFAGIQAEPMRRALSGKSGVTIAADYRGVTVLAAHEPVRELGLGLVAKIDLAEVRAPYVRVAAAGLLAAVTVVLGGLLVMHFAKPVLQRAREREAMLATAQAMARMGCWSFDLAADKITWSDELYRVFGYEPRSVTPSYELFTSHIHPEDRARVTAAIAEGRTRGGPFTYSYRQRRADGTERIIETHGQTFTNDKGEVTRLFGVTQDVTERKQAEREIRDLARFPGESPIPVLRARLNGRLIYANEASRPVLEQLGIQNGDPLPLKWMAVLTDAVKEKSFRTFEVGCADKHYIFSARPIADTDYVNFYGMDITAREQAELALREREAQYRAVIETTADGFWVVDMEGCLREVNDAYVRRSGYTREELLGMRMTDVEAVEKPEETAAHIAKVMRDGSDLFESWHRAKDGSLWPVEINVSHWPAAAGGRLFVFLRDIGARRSAKAQMQTLSRALAQSADAVMVTDRHGVIEFVNPALETMTGYTRAELIGRKPNVFRSGIQDAAFYRRMWDTILGGDVFSEVLVNRRKDGSLYYEEKLISPIKDDDGNITHFVATARDITERMATQEQLQHLAHHDALTELPNRTLFFDRLKQTLARARRHGRTFAVLFLDLDGFKRINDVHGHEAGDRFLKDVAARLRTAMRASDTVARFGGDEFVFVVDDLPQATDLAFIAAKIRQAFAAPIALAEGEFPIGASIGVSFYPDDGADADMPLKCADAAMYRAKSLGEGGVRFHPSL